jgi:hypothetical protein
MASRLIFGVLAAFWITMNVLLWRAEYGSQAAMGSTIPAHVVWGKILTAPDSSSLTIFRKGKRIGFCHWITSVGEDLARMSSGETPPEGMVRKIVNYRLDLDGNVMLGTAAERLRFDSHLSLGSDRTWRDFELRLNLRPETWLVRSLAAEQTIRVNWQDDHEKFERIFRFSELQNPEAIVQEFVGPAAALLLNGMGLPSLKDPKTRSALVLQWEARTESVKLGHASVRAYRLQAHLLDRYNIVVFVSRAGEILRVELPEGITLANDQLGGN